MSVCVVGRGKVGRALYRALREADVSCALVRGRGARQPVRGFRTYLLAVPDARIRALAEQLAPALDRRACVLHCAGARGVDELIALAQQGIAVAVFHPLVAFASSKPTELRGATFTSLGDKRATREAKRLARSLGARCVVLEASTTHEQAARYHAAAALVANGATALADVGVRILCELGYAKRDAERALAGLLTSAASNIASVGVPAALTGPVVRGDTATVARHLAALASVDRSASRAYAALQPVVVASARARGLAAKDARAILRTSRAYTKE